MIVAEPETLNMRLQSESMEVQKKCVNGSAELCNLQDALDNLAELLRSSALSRADYDVQYAEKLVQREKIIARTPHFWMRALISHPSVGMLITISDCPRLEALIDVRCVMHNRADFDIVFTFAENNFFSNTTLTKTYRNKEWSGLIVGSEEIFWKENMAPDSEFATHEDEYGMYSPSFLEWFTTPGDCRQLGYVIRDEIFPNAVHLFRGSWHPYDEYLEDTDSDSSTSTEAGR